MLILLAACAGAPAGSSEALQIREGTFMAGDLPSDETASTPTITSAAARSFIATQGQGNLGYSGLASPDSWSVAVWFPGVSTGYWVVPVEGLDLTQDGDRIFGLTVDFGRDVPYGPGELELVALDADGRPGPAYISDICVLPDYADDNYAVCSPDIPPQHTIVSLRWDTPVDLDLVVVTPSGKVVSAKNPTTAVDADEDGELDEDLTTGALSRDSNGTCHIDGFDLESLVFAEEPPAGSYTFYASLFSACDQDYVNFSASLYQRVVADDGGWSMTETVLPHGELLAVQADGGTSFGTFVTSLTLP